MPSLELFAREVMPEFQGAPRKAPAMASPGSSRGFPTRLTPPSNGVFERRSALFLYAQEVRMAKPDQIQDETLRTLVLEARAAYLGWAGDGVITQKSRAPSYA